MIMISKTDFESIKNNFENDRMPTHSGVRALLETIESEIDFDWVFLKISNPPVWEMRNVPDRRVRITFYNGVYHWTIIKIREFSTILGSGSADDLETAKQQALQNLDTHAFR